VTVTVRTSTWDPRRGNPRHTADLYAVVIFGTVVQPARLKDVSAGGVLIDGIGGLRRGMPVSFELISGHKYSGVVAWSADHKTGLRFSKQIPAGDPLLGGAVD
jgi:hypothetical protein